MIHGRLQPEFFRIVNAAIKGRPTEHLGVGQVIVNGAEFPNALVWLVPTVFQSFQNFALQLPNVIAQMNAVISRQVKHFQELAAHRSEEHTSELQSRGHLVCRLLLEKKKNHRTTQSIALTTR